MSAINSVGDWIQLVLIQSWQWFNSLSYQEWFVVLGITAMAGFICMRGFGSRGRS